MVSLQHFIYEALNEKSALSMLQDLYSARATVEDILPDAVVEFIVENGKAVETYKDMKDGKDYIVLSPNMWNDAPQMQFLTYWEGFKFQENMGEKKAPSWVFTFEPVNSARNRGKFYWQKNTSHLPSACMPERMDKNGKKPFCKENYHIIEVTPKLKSFIKDLIKM
jgi:hypothetical protein